MKEYQRGGGKVNNTWEARARPSSPSPLGTPVGTAPVALFVGTLEDPLGLRNGRIGHTGWTSMGRGADQGNTQATEKRRTHMQTSERRTVAYRDSLQTATWAPILLPGDSQPTCPTCPGCLCCARRACLGCPTNKATDQPTRVQCEL